MFKYFVYLIRGAYKLAFYYPKINRYYRHKNRYPIEKRYAFARKLILIMFKAMGVSFVSKDIEKLAEFNGGLIVANHQSFLDPLILIALKKEPILFLSKVEAKDYHLAGKISYFIDSLFIDNKDLKGSVKILKECENYIAEGRTVVIFPEGKRSKDYSVDTFRAGALKPAFSNKSDILPIFIDGAYKPLNKEFKSLKYEIRVDVLDKIDYDFYKEKATVEVANYIENNLRDLKNKKTSD